MGLAPGAMAGDRGPCDSPHYPPVQPPASILGLGICLIHVQFVAQIMLFEKCNLVLTLGISVVCESKINSMSQFISLLLATRSLAVIKAC